MHVVRLLVDTRHLSARELEVVDFAVGRLDAIDGVTIIGWGDNPGALTIGDTCPAGLFQIVDTRPGDGDVLFVTVRELVGDRCLDMTDTDMVSAMRELAHLAYDGAARFSPEHTRSRAYGCVQVTFAVSGAPA